MSNIPPVGHASNLSALDPSSRPPPTTAGPAAAPPTGDSAVVSLQAQYLSKLASLDVRQDLIDRVKSEIASSQYEKPEQLAAKVDALLDELQEDLQ